MRSPGYLRNYESTLVELAKRGHSIVLSFDIWKDNDKLHEVLLAQYPDNISYRTELLPRRNDSWHLFANLLRGMRDYSRYFHPDYVDAHELRVRIGNRLGAGPSLFLRVLNRIPRGAGLACFDNAARFLEKVIPCSQQINKFLLEQSPDIVLFTPLTDYCSPQTDYLKSAKELSMPCALCVHSWDNLTNKGLIHIQPDYVFVWNHHQKLEAITYHSIEPDRVIVTGAQCYDKWFDQCLQTSQAEFLEKVGLNPSYPYILYLCSSRFIAPKEVKFVKKILHALRTSEDESLNNLGLLVRPHPQNADQWQQVDFSRWGNTAIWPSMGENPVSEQSRANFYDSIAHSHGVVGINTSAMIEAGILGKPVFTILGNFKETQHGTLHFHYLLNGGLLQISESIGEFLSQLKLVFNSKLDYESKIQVFIEDFVRPTGIESPCTPILVSAIETASKSNPSVFGTQDVRVAVWRLTLTPLAYFSQGFYSFFLAFQLLIPRIRSAIVKFVEKPISQIASFTKAFVSKVLVASSKNIVDMYFETTQALGFHDALKNEVLPHVIDRAQNVMLDESVIENVIQSIRNVETVLGSLQNTSSPIIVGPWLSEVGFEILYWIPFLNWFFSTYDICEERVIILSRGGTSYWYGSQYKYIDIFDYYSPEEFKLKNKERCDAVGSQKHEHISPFDIEIISRVKESLNLDEVFILHPSLIYGLFKEFWRRKAPLNLVNRYSTYKFFDPIPSDGVLEYLPESYIAIKFYYSKAFPKTPQNRQFVIKILDILTKQNNIVLLNTGLDIDDHSEAELEHKDRVYHISKFMTPNTNLMVQTQVISKASAFWGTYGGFSYLSSFYGVPSIAFYSHEGKFHRSHLDVAYRACRVLKYGEFDKIVRRHDNSYLRLDTKPEFIALSTLDFETLTGLIG
jgi:hypothetical protein